MHVPISPASYTALLHDAGPAPWHAPQRIEVGAEWTPIPGTGVAMRAPALARSRALAALACDDVAREAARVEVDLRYTRRMVAELVALVSL